MNKDEFDTVDDMALEDEEKPERLNMDLDDSSSASVGSRIQKLFPNEDLVDILDKFKIVKMASGSYQIDGTPVEEIESWEQDEIDAFLKSRKG